MGLGAVFLAAAPVDAGRARPCDRDRITSANFSPAQATGGLLCLINGERVARGVRPLRPSALLRRAARGHAGDLVQRRYFGHRSPEGLRARDRIRVTGYLHRARAWRIGEVIGYADAEPTAVQRLERTFMHSPRHRRILLNGRFDAVGIGIARGWPVPDKRTPGFTAVVNLGYVVRAR